MTLVFRPASLDAATALEPTSTGFRATLDPAFDNATGVPQGGYVLAVAVRAALEATGRPHFVTTSAHYMRPVQPGQCDVAVEVVRKGRRFDVVRVQIDQGGTSRMTAVATLGDLAADDGPSHDPAMPDFPELLPIGRPPFDTPINEHYFLELEDDHHGFLEGRPREHPRAFARVTATDGSPLDQLSLPVLADWRPPAPFLVGHFGKVPTVELDLHTIAPPPWSALRTEVALETLRGGQAIESARFWDDDGRLVATCRQLMLLRS